MTLIEIGWVWQSAAMALHGHPVPRRHFESGEANAFLGSANPAVECRVSAPLHELPPGWVPADVAYQLIHDELLIDGMTNHPKARHVLAAAVRANAEVIVTFNLADFPEQALKAYDIAAIHPDEFLPGRPDLT